jgi:hypothetical protein
VQDFGISYGDRLLVTVQKGGQQVYRDTVLFGNTFSVVPAGKPVAYANSLLNLSLGINQGNFAQEFKIRAGEGWEVFIEKVRGMKGH